MPKRNALADLLLDPVNRTAEPAEGQLGFVRMFGEPDSMDESKRTMRFRCSTKNMDRYSEIVEPDAFAKWLPTFMQNPVFMAGHQYIAPDGNPTTIGRWLELDITDDGLDGVAEFMDDDELAERYWKRYSRGFQKAVSVGWITHAWEMKHVEIDGEQQRVRVFRDVELVEISAVAIPANRESLVRAASAFAPLLGTDAARELGETDKDDALSKALEPAVERVLNKLLHAGPGGHLCALLQDVVEASRDHADFGLDDDDDILDDEIAPDPSSASKGENNLKHELRQLAATARGGDAQQ